MNDKPDHGSVLSQIELEVLRKRVAARPRCAWSTAEDIAIESLRDRGYLRGRVVTAKGWEEVALDALARAERLAGEVERLERRGLYLDGVVADIRDKNACVEAELPVLRFNIEGIMAERDEARALAEEQRESTTSAMVRLAEAVELLDGIRRHTYGPDKTINSLSVERIRRFLALDEIRVFLASTEPEAESCLDGEHWDGGDSPPTPCGECPSCLATTDQEAP